MVKWELDMKQPTTVDRWFYVYGFGRMMSRTQVPDKRIFTNKEFREILHHMADGFEGHRKTMALLHELSKFSPGRLREDVNRRIAELFNAAHAKHFKL